MTAKAYLTSIKTMREKIDAKNEKIQVLRSAATNTTSRVTGMPHNPSKDTSPMAAAVSKIIDLEKEVETLEQERQAAILTLCSMPDADSSTLLLKRYVQEETFEQIAVEMQYSERSIYYLHKQAVAQFAEHLKHCS